MKVSTPSTERVSPSAQSPVAVFTHVKRLTAWTPLFLLPAATLLLVPTDWPRWAVMWALAVAVYVGCKWLTWLGRYAQKAPVWRHLAYWLAWPGLDAPQFLGGTDVRARRPTAREWAFAVAKTVLGVSVLYGVTRLIPAELPLLTGWVGMVGLVFVLHFGLFHLLSCAWRATGVAALPLMRWPVAAANLSDFWGRRWNTAFRDATHRFLFRSLAGRFGPRTAVITGFVMSGLVHDLVISFPAGGGYGRPTAYFLLQALALLAERSQFGQRFGIGFGWRGRAFTGLVVVGPAPLLFHAPFVERVILPFLASIGAL